MLFSILIAHYNNWDYFQDCYRSIKEQSYKDYEIVIVDDCSTDGSYEKLRDLATTDILIKLFRNEENRKVGFTKRRCVEEATGSICGFLDPDDVLAETALEEVVNTYKSDHTIAATYSKIKLINKNAEVIGDFKSTKKIKNNNPYFFNINFEVAHFFTFKKESYNLTEGINPELTSAVDQDLYLKLYEKGNFLLIDKILYFYRLHDKGVSQNQLKKASLNKNWHSVLQASCKRRNIKQLYGKDISNIECLNQFIFQKENSIIKKILRKISW